MLNIVLVHIKSELAFQIKSFSEELSKDNSFEVKLRKLSSKDIFGQV